MSILHYPRLRRDPTVKYRYHKGLLEGKEMAGDDPVQMEYLPDMESNERIREERNR